MKLNETLTKRYYTIGQVCKMLDVSPSLIYHWEMVFKDLHYRRDSKGGRRFTPDNIRKLVEIHTLVKERGFTLEGAREELLRLKKHPQQETIRELEDISQGLKSLLLELESSSNQ